MERRCILCNTLEDMSQTRRLHISLPRKRDLLQGYGAQHRCTRTIACKPARVRIYRWWTRPYNISADDSTIETSGIFDVSSSSMWWQLSSQKIYSQGMHKD